MSKKSKIKLAIKKAMSHYYKSGFTNTASRVKKDIWLAVDKAFKS